MIRTFNSLGIPNFLVAQCLCLIEGNLMHQKETQLEDMVPLAADVTSSKSRLLLYKIHE